MEPQKMTLFALRKKMKLTQMAVANKMGISQPSVQKLENQKDMQVSTLDRYIRAIGGTMELQVVINGERLRLNLPGVEK